MQDLALPIATKSNSLHSRLRLCNKLTELMLSLKLYVEAVEFAQTALDISVTLGMENFQHKVSSFLCLFWVVIYGCICSILKARHCDIIHERMYVIQLF